MLSIDRRIQNLKELDELQIELIQAILAANGGIFYSLDLVFLAALNRSRSNINAFISLLKLENYIGALPFVRMQLDSVLRIYALWLVDAPQELAEKILNGERLNTLKDRTGRNMTDKRLCEAVAQHEPWVSKVYNSGSGFIHLSNTHIASLFLNKSQLSFGARQPHVAMKHGEEAVAAMEHVSKLLFELSKDWLNRKSSIAI